MATRRSTFVRSTALRRGRLALTLAGVAAVVSLAACAALPIVSNAARGIDVGAAPGVVQIDDGGASAFDDTPAITNLSPELRTAVQRAATDAAADGVEFIVTSGWRTPEYQNQLLEDAVAEYGSREEAAKWVATAETSAHVSGEAVDIGEFDASYWLSQNGARYGLCQIYSNESWHFELRERAVTEGCPLQFEDPTHDPRMTP